MLSASPPQSRGGNSQAVMMRNEIVYEPVATLRDQFAMAALPAICDVAAKIRVNIGKSNVTPWSTVAEGCYAAADAMLAARDRKAGAA